MDFGEGLFEEFPREPWCLTFGQVASVGGLQYEPYENLI